ncbi:unnamed protein product, partial [Bubo scandiacus]
MLIVSFHCAFFFTIYIFIFFSSSPAFVEGALRRAGLPKASSELAFFLKKMKLPPTPHLLVTHSPTHPPGGAIFRQVYLL